MRQRRSRRLQYSIPRGTLRVRWQSKLILAVSHASIALSSQPVHEEWRVPTCYAIPAEPAPVGPEPSYSWP